MAQITTDDSGASSAAPVSACLAAVAGLVAAWCAAGSTGLLAHPLRHSLTWLLLGIAIVAELPCLRNAPARALAVIAAVTAAVVMTASHLPVVNVMAIMPVLVVLALCSSGPGRSILLLASMSVAVLGVYIQARTSIPLVWLAADHLAGLFKNSRLWVGASFAGVDFLVVMAVLYTSWLLSTAPPRRYRAFYGALAILLGHALYLVALAYAPDILPAAPSADPEAAWSWAGAVRKLIPWNLPILACAIHAAIAAAIFRWSQWPAPPLQDSAEDAARRRTGLLIAATTLAALLPVVTMLSTAKPTLDGRKIVVSEKGFLNWLKPEHDDYGRLSIGMYGMLPIYIESLGGRCIISPELSEDDLNGADLLILLYPNEPWADGQLDRIWNFVRSGGSLLLMGEHTIRESDGGNRFNDVLEPTAMNVRFDSATFEVGGWLQSYEAISHPATAGIPDDRNQFGAVIGASVRAHWPARPLLVGR